MGTFSLMYSLNFEAFTSEIKEDFEDVLTWKFSFSLYFNFLQSENTINHYVWKYLY